MAGGRDKNKRGGSIIDKASPRHDHYEDHAHHSLVPKSPTSEGFKRRERKELERNRLRCADALQEDVFRIFAESLHCDLKIIHGYKVVQTNQCIVRSRSPHLYDVLKPYFIYKNRTACCCLRKPGIYRQVKNFVRLLYTNSDLSRKEELLVRLITSSFCPFETEESLQTKKRQCDGTTLSYYGYRNAFRHGATTNDVDASPTLSDMADSGLETGSTSPQEAPSENSVADFDDCHVADYSSASEDANKLATQRDNKQRHLENDFGFEKKNDLYNSRIRAKGNDEGAGSSVEQVDENQKINDEISKYETQVLSDAFYESDDESESQSFVFVKSAASPRNERPVPDEKSSDRERREKTSSSSSNNYYFIDASTLNDDVVFATDVSCQKDLNGRISSYIPHYESTIANCTSFAPTPDEVTCNLRLTQYLEPKRYDSIAEIGRSTDKESLVVEIKEADSGESTQHSPCPDNTKITSEKVPFVDNDRKRESEEVKECNGVTEEERRPSLIRENTFELDSSDEKLSALRQEYERRQGSIVFLNSITQYSQHRLDGDSYFDSAIQSCSLTDDTLSNLTSDTETSNGTKFAPAPFITLDKYDLDAVEKETKQTSDQESSVSYPAMKSTSDKFLLNYMLTSDHDADGTYCSLPISLSSITKCDDVDTARKVPRDETLPLISGGVSASDIAKPPESPVIRRRTESTPIVSGGAVNIPEPLRRIKPVKAMSSSMSAWVVDMSDCTSPRAKNPQGAMSQSFSSSETATPPLKNQEKQSSTGFFVDLNDLNTSQTKKEVRTHRRERSVSSDKQNCKFFVDLSESTTKIPVKSKKSEVKKFERSHSIDEAGDKKNIFSMFIDLGPNDAGVSKLAEKRQELQDRLSGGNGDEAGGDTSRSEESSDERKIREKAKAGVFMFIESDSPVVRRRTMSSSRPTFKRHSWNIDKTNQLSTTTNGSEEGVKEQTLVFRKEHKRAQSLSVDRSDFRKMIAKSSNSSHSLSEAARASNPNETSNVQENCRNTDTPTEDIFEYDIRDTPPNSHVEIITEELRVSVKEHEYQELLPPENAGTDQNAKTADDEVSESSVWEKTATESTEGNTRKSETFDISSGSGPSSGCENHDFELAEMLNGKITSYTERSPIIPPSSGKILETHKSLNEKIKKIECELKGPEFDENEILAERRNKKTINLEAKKAKTISAPPASFVRLSDLDKGSTDSPESSVREEVTQTYRMTSSIPETSWIESKLVMTRTNGPMRTAPRKLPSNMSTSLPSKQKSPLDEVGGEMDVEGIVSESDLSSMQSSMGRSGAEGSTEETETSSFASKPQNKLGEDMLRMFLEEINPDVTIDISGRRIRAHKCILSSRCQYFAAILSGGWIESAGNIISLQGYSYNAVHFALCHIYSGESNIPDTISIVELATLADMLCLEGLKEVIGYTLKVKYCHLFHKPCQVCAVGVLECMPLAAAYGLDEIYRKSLRWITRHFVRVWPCKAFATLPRELMDKCYHQHIVHMSVENVLQTMMDCDKLLATLPNVRWAEPVFRLVSNLLETTLRFLSDNFQVILGTENFQSLGRDLTWNISRLEDNFLATAERLAPDQACKSYLKLHKMLSPTLSEDMPGKPKWGPVFVDFVKKIQMRVEKCLVRDAPRAARCTSWLKMDLELRRRIQELACLVILPNELSKRQSRHSNFMKEPKVPNRSPMSRSVDLRKVKIAISEHNDKTQKQPVVQAKKVLNKPKTDPLERKVQNKPTTEIRPKSWPNKSEVKSRYLEPRNRSITKESSPAVQDKVVVQRKKIMISSSDSSRTSSPAMKRAADKKNFNRTKTVKKDTKALSSDSLADPLVRLTAKKDSISKSCGITRPESPSLKNKDADAGLSIDSLAESKKKPVAKKQTKMDTSMSTDSLMGEICTTPKSKLSPTLNRVNKPQLERFKKLSPPTQKSPLSAPRRPMRSLESSTAASRSRAAATYAPNLRKNLLEAAKTPEVKMNTSVSSRSSIRSSQSMGSPFSTKRRESLSNQSSQESPTKRSPKSNGTSRIYRSTVSSKQKTSKVAEEKKKSGDIPKHLTVGSRSGTFLKDEPTVLKKSDLHDIAHIDI